MVAAARAICAVLATRQLEAIRRAHAKEKTDGREAGSLRRPLRRRDDNGRVASTEANVPTIARADANAADVGMIPLAAQRGSTPEPMLYPDCPVFSLDLTRVLRRVGCDSSQCIPCA